MRDYIHDLIVMLEHDDLKTASLELLAADRTVLYRHQISFIPATKRQVVDAAGGIEMPLLSADSIADHRLLLSPVRKIAQYRHLLRHSWTAAEKLPERSGTSFASEHTQRINGGRMTGKVFVSNEARRTATVINVSHTGKYAFAREPALRLDVYLHKAHCEFPFDFQPGMKVSFVPIPAIRGIQGRNIRPA